MASNKNSPHYESQVLENLFLREANPFNLNNARQINFPSFLKLSQTIE